MCYFETCKRATSEIDVEKLTSAPLGPTLGRGSGYEFHPFGFTLPKTDQYIGIKTSRYQKAEAEPRLVGELAFFRLMLEGCPDLKANAPSFMSLARSEDSGQALGIITQDISLNGTRILRPVLPSIELQKKIYAAFEYMGRFSEIVNEEACESLVFEVDGKQVIADSTPEPIKRTVLANSEEYQQSFSEALSVISDVTIEIPSDSPLGISFSLAA